ncbi:SMP-30/gluconolactonase/LRE family protein [Vibrio methylphosphonaticus]|uniref:SMP-30/gluconolactonase/LRE family protein n=1 Tax=Vibrio methylphosphonaticus TaxID=2946866 RepID=UPI00202A81E1|nr:SMP-30/gluconolactonase/LRE family protein [Vibrio methylphosphonaticus]MCL9775918.1 SMP-30/gluconolactonase/LRE family protein [Vibrio methylphosphonaticus]
MQVINNVVTTIGESPIWKPDTNSVVWVEAAGQAIYEYSLQTTTVATFSVPFDITAIARCDDNGWVCASKQGLFYCSMNFDKFIPIIDPCFSAAHLHLNDAVTSPVGTLWFGSMNHAQLEAPDGKFYQLTDGVAKEMDTGFSVANGIAFNPILKRVYCSNMFQRKVYEYQLDDSMGRILDKAVFVEFEENQGYPDGLTVDRQGNLYVCHWDGGIISYYSANAQQVGVATPVGEINLPVKHATRCTFGGDDFNTLFITTANFELTDQEISKYPLSGHLLMMDAPTTGREEYLINSIALPNLKHAIEPLTS